MSLKPILRAQNLTKEFKGFKAVDDVSFSVEEGAIHALIGPNGAGKTTCFNLLTKFLIPSSGSVLLEGKDITRSSPAQVARMGLVRSFQISSVFPSHTCIENVLLALQSRGGESFDFWKVGKVSARSKDQAAHYLEMVGMEDFADAVVDELPYGRKRALEIATTLALEPKVMLLDEPTSGMTSADIEQISRLIGKVRAGRTIVMVEHHLDVVADLSDRITVLNLGQVLTEGTYDEVANDPRVLDVYMGGHDHDE